MVLAGQYLERPAVVRRPVPGGFLTLEGLFHRGTESPAVLVCAPHPRMGGSMDSPVVAELAWAVTRRGHASLRFNYQGVGASQGAIAVALPEGSGAAYLTALGSELADASAALEHLRETAKGAATAIVGYSFGAAIALGLAQKTPEIGRIVLVAPPTGLFDFSPAAALARPTLVVYGADDSLVEPAALAPLASTGVRIEAVPGSDHVFSRGLTELGRRVAEWMGES